MWSSSGCAGSGFRTRQPRLTSQPTLVHRVATDLRCYWFNIIISVELPIGHNKLTKTLRFQLKEISVYNKIKVLIHCTNFLCYYFFSLRYANTKRMHFPGILIHFALINPPDVLCKLVRKSFGPAFADRQRKPSADVMMGLHFHLCENTQTAFAGWTNDSDRDELKDNEQSLCK